MVARRSYTASKPPSSVSTMSEGDRLITTNRRPGPHSTLLPQTTWACTTWEVHERRFFGPLTGDVTDDAFLDARGESMGFEDADRFPSEQFAPTALVGCACRILIDGLLEPSVPVRPPSTDGLVDAQIKPRFVSTSHESLRRIAASAINAMQDMTAEDGVACGTASYIHRVPP